MPRFEMITDRIYRLKVPFQSVYTAVFLIKCRDGCMLVDAATTSEDAVLILDAVKELGVDIGCVSHILITHAHGDHAGGLRALCDATPHAVVCAGSEYLCERYSLERFELLQDGAEIYDGITAISLSGHSPDSYGYFDVESGCLISGDGVQLCGIGRYGTGLSSFDDYLSTLDKIAGMQPSMLVCSHEYYPYGSIAVGDELKRYIADSIRYARYIIREIDECVLRGVTDAALICDHIREKNRQFDSKMPILQLSTVKAYINAKK